MRAASEALDEYIAILHSTDAYQAANPISGQVSLEVNRVMSEVEWRDGEWNPLPGPDGCGVIGSGVWTWGADGKHLRLSLSGLLWSGRWGGFMVQHTLGVSHLATGSVWLGVANNSARVDIARNHIEAWKLWSARGEATGR